MFFFSAADPVEKHCNESDPGCRIETHRTPTGDGNNNVKLIFKMENKRGASITNVSQSGQPEGEVLHKTNESCTIKSVRKQGFYYVATLEDSE